MNALSALLIGIFTLGMVVGGLLVWLLWIY